MYKKLLIFTVTSTISLLSVSVPITITGAFTQNRLLNNAVKIYQPTKLTNNHPSPSQIQNPSQYHLIPTDSSTYYNPELWHTYQRLQSQKEGIPTRSAIAVYVGAKTLVKQQQQPLAATRFNSQGRNGAKLTKDIIIFLRKQGYLKYFCHQ